MLWDEWRFSARRALQHPFIKWTLAVTGLFVVCGSAYFLLRLVPEGLHTGTLILHYNVYLGVDDVGAWQWILLSPALMVLLFLINAAFSLGYYHSDSLASKSVVALTACVAIVWGVSSFFLILVNV